MKIQGLEILWKVNLNVCKNLNDIIPYETCLIINEQINILNTELAKGEYEAGKTKLG